MIIPQTLPSDFQSSSVVMEQQIQDSASVSSSFNNVDARWLYNHMLMFNATVLGKVPLNGPMIPTVYFEVVGEFMKKLTEDASKSIEWHSSSLTRSSTSKEMIAVFRRLSSNSDIFNDTFCAHSCVSCHTPPRVELALISGKGDDEITAPDIALALQRSSSLPAIISAVRFAVPLKIENQMGSVYCAEKLMSMENLGRYLSSLPGVARAKVVLAVITQAIIGACALTECQPDGDVDYRYAYIPDSIGLRLHDDRLRVFSHAFQYTGENGAPLWVTIDPNYHHGMTVVFSKTKKYQPVVVEEVELEALTQCVAFTTLLAVIDQIGYQIVENALSGVPEIVELMNNAFSEVNMGKEYVKRGYVLDAMHYTEMGNQNQGVTVFDVVFLGSSNTTSSFNHTKFLAKCSQYLAPTLHINTADVRVVMTAYAPKLNHQKSTDITHRCSFCGRGVNTEQEQNASCDGYCQQIVNTITGMQHGIPIVDFAYTPELIVSGIQNIV